MRVSSARIIPALFLLLPGAAAAQDEGIPLGSDVARAVATITPSDVLARIAVLADDSMRGRNTPSPELDEVAGWIASEFRSFGLKPGGDEGSFIQRYPLRRVQLDTDRSVVRITNGPTWRVGRDAARLFGATGPEGISGRIAVLTGQPSDPGDFNNLDVADRIVFWVVPTNQSGVPNFRLINQGFRGISGGHPGAVILVMDRPGDGWRTVLDRQSTPALLTGWGEDGGLPLMEVPVAAATDAFRTRVNLEATRSRPLELHTLDNMTASVTAVRRTVEELSAPNVVGILEGSDPVLKNEYVVFSAHMDHVGVGRPVDGDSIYNGADDDASGTTGVMELAEAFSALATQPRRSLIFLTVSGEEKGLWGSDYFARHPGVPIEEIVADLNTDMIGRNWPDTIVVIGKEHSDLGETLNRVNQAHPELNMTAMDDIWPEENFYFRSDHFNFARRGVPILFFFNGTHPDYHRPSDQVEKIDAEKESRIVKLVFYLGLDIANRTERPKWNPESYEQIVGSSR